MAHDTIRSDVRPAEEASPSPLWSGMIGFASIMMVLVGGFHVLGGFVALLEQRYYEVSSSELLFVDYTAWGIAHMTLGALACVAGVALFLRKTWARIVAVVVASFSAVINLAFLSAAPGWYGLMILLDVLVIYSVTVHFDDELD